MDNIIHTPLYLYAYAYTCKNVNFVGYAVEQI